MKRLKPILVLVIMTVSFFSTGYAQFEDPYFGRAIRHYQQGNFRAAVEDLNKTIQENPKNGLAFYYRGYARFYAKDYANAEKDLKQALRYEKNCSVCLSAYGHLLNETGRYKEAAKMFDKAVEINPFFTEAYNNRGVSWHRLGNFRKAIADFSRAIQLDSTFALAYNNRGSARYYNQDVSEPHRNDILLALADFEAALRHDPGLALAVRNRGIAKSFLGEYEEAVSILNQAIQMAPNDPVAYMNRARVRYETGDFQGAIGDFMKTLSIDPYIEDAYIEMGNSKSRLEYFEEAIQDQLIAIRLNKSYEALAFYNIACNFSLMGDKENALFFLNKAMKKNYFSNKKAFAHFLKDPDFNNLRKDPDFMAFTDKLRKKVNR